MNLPDHTEKRILLLAYQNERLNRIMREHCREPHVEGWCGKFKRIREIQNLHGARCSWHIEALARIIKWRRS